MTQIDEKAFEVALHVLELKHASIKDETRAVITAYLAALPPPAGDVGDLIASARLNFDYRKHEWPGTLVSDFADALTTLSTKLASRDREISALMDKADNFERAAVANYRRAKSAEARAERLEGYIAQALSMLPTSPWMASEKLLDALSNGDK